MRPAFFVFFGLCPAVYAPAQQGSLTGPVEGYTFDAPTRSIRAVIGFPGAASFGPVLRDSLDFASIAPRQTYGLGFQRGQSLFISGLGTSALSSRDLAGVESEPERVVWSGDGSSAMLYSISGNWLQSVSGFPGAPTAGPRIDGSSLNGVIGAVAVDGQGKRIAVGVSGDAGAVYWSSDGQTFTLLSPVSKPASLSFSTDGATLYALDSGASQVLAIDWSSHTSQGIPLNGLGSPVAIQFVLDSESRPLLYVADASARLVRVIDVTSQQTVADVPLGFKPTRLDQFGANSFVAASRAQAGNPLWLFTDVPQLAAYFVPAVHLRRPEHKMPPVVRGAQ
jgi:hypothetical protein